jgi:peroxiredoxin
MSFHKYVFILLVALLTGCGDLNPSPDDLRPPVDTSQIGSSVGQPAPDFALFDTQGNPITMSAELSGADGIVLYFTMWCPICDSHMSHLRTQVIPNFPKVKFFIIDFVSGTISDSLTAQEINGYTDLTVLVDDAQEVLNLYDANMGITVVIDSTGIVRMNEYYKDATKLIDTLTALP